MLARIKSLFRLIKKARPFINPRPSPLERLKKLEAYYKNS